MFGISIIKWNSDKYYFTSKPIQLKFIRKIVTICRNPKPSSLVTPAFLLQSDLSEHSLLPSEHNQCLCTSHALLPTFWPRLLQDYSFSLQSASLYYTLNPAAADALKKSKHIIYSSVWISSTISQFSQDCQPTSLAESIKLCVIQLPCPHPNLTLICWSSLTVTTSLTFLMLSTHPSTSALPVPPCEMTLPPLLQPCPSPSLALMSPTTNVSCPEHYIWNHVAYLLLHFPTWFTYTSFISQLSPLHVSSVTGGKGVYSSTISSILL